MFEIPKIKIHRYIAYFIISIFVHVFAFFLVEFFFEMLKLSNSNRASYSLIIESDSKKKILM